MFQRISHSDPRPSPRQRKALRSLRVLVLGVLVLGLLLPGGSAQAEQWPVMELGAESGLPSSEVVSIDRDPLGFLWLGTVAGLVRYDGQRFVTWRTGRDLPAAAINDVAWAGGRHWLATSRGILRSLPEAASFEVVADLGEAEARLVWTDPTDGTLWISVGARLLRVDPLSTEILEEPNLSEMGLRAPIREAVLDRNGDRWFAADGGVLRRASTGWVSYPLGDWGLAKRVVSLDAGPDGCLRLVAGLRLVSFRPSDTPKAGSRALAQPTRAPGAGTGCPQDSESSWWVGPPHGLPDVYWDGDVLTDSRGVVWVGTSAGLARGEEASWRLLTDREGFPSRRVRRLVEDAHGNLWAATKFRGALVLLAQGFRTWTGQDGLADGERDFTVKSIFEAKDGSMYAVTGVEGGVRRIESQGSENWRSVSPKLPANIERLGWGRRQMVLVDALGSWWVGTNAGAVRWDDPVSGVSLDHRPPDAVFGIGEGLGPGPVLSLFEDRHGDVWFGTDGKHPVSRWIRTEDRVEAFGPESGIPPRARAAYTFAEDLQGQLWIGLYRQGILRWDGSRLRHFGVSQGVPTGRVTDLHIDGQGRLWASSIEGGLIVCDDPSQSEIQFQPASLPGVRVGVEAIDEDERGVLWLGTEGGLLRWRPGSATAERFGTATGLISPRVLVLHRDLQGSLWVGTPGGISRFAELPVGSKPGRPVFTAVSVDEEPVAISMLGQKAVTLVDLPSGDHQLLVQVAAPTGSLAGGGPIEWRWGTSEWSPVQADGELRLAGIGAGRHRLEVRPAFSEPDGTPVDPFAESAVLELRVDLPLWRRPEFSFVVGLLLCGLLAVWHRTRLRRLLEVERVRTRVAADLHDDLGSTLSRISVQAELALRSPRESTRLLEEVGESAQEGLEAMRDLVWALDPDQDDLGALFGRLRHFATRQLEPVGVGFELMLAPEIRGLHLGGEARRDLFLTLKEAITNAAKHADAKRVTLRAGFDESLLCVLVEDDGKGIHRTPDGVGGRGLPNMRQRAKNLGGSLEITSLQPRGSRVRLVIPLRRLDRRRSERET